MLKTIFEHFGFIGSLALSLLLFVFFILWMSGIAGITQPLDGGKPRYKHWMVWVSILFPPFPIIWIVHNLTHHNRLMKRN
jgi:choline-glycine betaine transporter